MKTRGGRYRRQDGISKMPTYRSDRNEGKKDWKIGDRGQSGPWVSGFPGWYVSGW